MIGQEKLINQFKQLIENNRFPQFCIICGKLGFGKHTISVELSKLLGKNYILVDNKIDNIRETIDMIYNNSETLYIFESADDMSINAKNVLLKVCEEPPKNTNIILLVENQENLLETIKTRAQLFTLLPYTKNELIQFANDNKIQPTETLLEIADCPGDILRLSQENNQDLTIYIKKVVDNLGRVSISNGLKIVKTVKTSKTMETGYDLDLFLNTLEYYCKKKYQDTHDTRFISFADIIVKNRFKFLKPSINKGYELDNIIIKGWLLWNYQN